MHLPPEFYMDMATLHRLLSDSGKASDKSWSDVWNASLALVVFKLRCNLDDDSHEMRQWLDSITYTKDELPEYATWCTR